MIKKKLYQNLLAVFMLLANISLSAVHIWEPMAILDSYQGIRDAKIVCDGNDNGAAAWFDSSAQRVAATFRPAGGVWETPVYYPITTNGQNKIDITMDQDGNVTLFFTDGVSPGSAIDLNTVYRPIGGTWGSPLTLYTTVVGDDIIELTSSSSSTSTQAIVAWLETVGTGIVKSRYRSGTTWAGTIQTVTALTSASTGLEKIIIKMVPNGNAQIAMLVQYSGTLDVYHTVTATPGSAWFGPPTSLNFVAIGGSPQGMDFDVNQSNGDAIVIEQHNSLNIFYNRRFSGIWLANPLLVQGGPAGTPGIGLANSNLTQGIWEHTGSIEIQTKGSTVAAAMTWPTPTTLATNTNSLFLSYPDVSMSPSGYFVLGWINSGSVTTRIGSGTTLEPNTTILDTFGNGQLWNVCMGDNDVAWAIWTTGGTVRASKTIFPQPTASGTLLQILGKKRLIYQKGLFP